MKLPQIISIQAKGESLQGISGLIFELGVTSGTKNRYPIIFPKTDRSGVAYLTCDEFRGQFEDHWEEGLMDYNGTVDTAIPTVTVELLNKVHIETNLEILRAWPLLKNEKKWWRSREEKFQYWLSCRNDEVYVIPSTWDIESMPEIELKVRTSG